MYFGSDHLGKHQNLRIIEGDIRDTKKIANCCNGYDIFLHLACISNDSSFELNEDLSKPLIMTVLNPW